MNLMLCCCFRDSMLDARNIRNSNNFPDRFVAEYKTRLLPGLTNR